MSSPIEQLLREQVVELTKLLELKDARIRELEALRSIPGNIIFPVDILTTTFEPANANAIETVTAANIDISKFLRGE
jgi:hypothetical protein